MDIEICKNFSKRDIVESRIFYKLTGEYSTVYAYV